MRSELGEGPLVRRAGNIARVLPKLVHFAAFARVRSLRQESRKTLVTSIYRSFLIGIPKMTFGIRIPVMLGGQSEPATAGGGGAEGAWV
jgi:hypothetical protein